MAVHRRLAAFHRGNRRHHHEYACRTGACAVTQARLVLASGSSSRRDMLRAAAIPFEVIVPAVDEEEAKAALLLDGTDSTSIADSLAELKSVHTSRLHPEAFVLGADQVLDCEGRSFSKAANRDEA